MWGPPISTEQSSVSPSSLGAIARMSTTSATNKNELILEDMAGILAGAI